MRYKKIRESNKMGAFLVDLLKLDQPEKGSPELHQDLIAVSAYGRRTAVRTYYVRKITRLILLLGAGIGLTVICLLVNAGTETGQEMRILNRPGYGEGDRKEILSVWVEGKEVQDFEITVQERKYTETEKEAILEAVLTELETIIPGKNASLDEVRYSLNLPQSMADGAVDITWITSPYGVIGEDGTIKKAEDENGTLVEITGTLNCDEKQMIYTSYARVFPSLLSESEQLLRDIRMEVESKEEQENHKETFGLPSDVNGKQLIWTKPSGNPVWAVLYLTLLAAAGMWIRMDQEVRKKAEKRREQLLLDYPDLMWKMTMLLGAGLSIKGSFARISEEYQREQRSRKMRSKRGQIRYVYEEVSYTCYEMNSGIPEAKAYERFGKRCQLPEYIRIGSVLSQNLKKGAKGLTSILETEAEASLNDRKNNARKIGEKAGTKLLLPMILMLAVVLAILMIPAFLSF